jgi:hypothetical protein
LCVLLLACTPAFSQLLTSNITARATDSTGAVIPGVEVTVSSPALIGGARKEVTDETGAYRFTLLPPGNYRVTFALPGFKTLNIDDNNLVAGTTITVNGKMEVASTAEEITVSSTAPTIDLESATVGVNISQKMMDELPWSRSLTGMSMMIPGVHSTSFDIGNSNFGTSSTIAASSGGRSGGNVVTIDGLVWCQTYSDYGSFEEMNVSTNAKGADQMNSGITLGMVVKAGGNQFHGNGSANYQNGSMQSNNISQALLDQGFPVGSNKYTHFDDIYADLGGPIMKDKFWFYGAYRRGYQGTFIPGFRTAVGGPLTDFWTLLPSYTAKFTYQLTDKQKLEAYMGYPDKHQPFRGGGKKEPKEATQNQDSWSSQGPMLTYTNIINSKTTLTAKITRGGYWWPGYTYGFNGDGFEGLGPNVAQLINGSLQIKRIPTVTWLGVPNVGVHITDGTSSSTDGAFASNYARPIRWQESADLSRFANIGGRNHELKVGYLGWWDKDYTSNFGYPYYQAYAYKSTSTETCPNDEICDTYFQHPDSVTFYSHPNKVANGALYRSSYVNDKITWNRKLTLNAGLRWDWATSFLPAQGQTGEGPYQQPFEIKDNQNYIVNPAYDGVGYDPKNVTGPGDKAFFPKYTLWSPRLSFAYDIFGDGKVAVKGSFGRYVGITSSPNSQPGPGENSGSVNPVTTTSCKYNGWKGDIPANSASYFGPDGVMGTSDDVGLSGSCIKTAFVGGQVLPISTYHFDSKLAPSYVSEYTASLDYGINRDYSVHFTVQRKFDRNGNKSINTLKPYDSYTEIRCAHDPGVDGVLSIANGGSATLSNGSANSSSDDDPKGQVCYYTVPQTINGKPNPVFSVTNVTYTATDQDHHEGNSSYTGYTFTFNKNYSHNWQYVVSYDLDMSHTVNTNPDTPNAVISNAKTIPVQWDNTLKMSGIYGAPAIPLFVKGFKLAGLQYSTSFISQTSGYYGRSAQVKDASGSTQTLTIDPRVGRYPRLNNWDQQIRKKFKIGETKQTLEFSWQLFNSLNADTLRSYSSTNSSSSSYLQPVVCSDANGVRSTPSKGGCAAGLTTINNGTTIYRPSSILSPRIYEWGVTYKF